MFQRFLHKAYAPLISLTGLAALAMISITLSEQNSDIEEFHGKPATIVASADPFAMVHELESPDPSRVESALTEFQITRLPKGPTAKRVVKAAAPPLVKLIANHKFSTGLRVRAVDTLATLARTSRDARVQLGGALGKVIAHPDYQRPELFHLRLKAASSLAKSHPKAAREALRIAAKREDEAPQIRLLAALGLARIQRKEGGKILAALVTENPLTINAETLPEGGWNDVLNTLARSGAGRKAIEMMAKRLDEDETVGIRAGFAGSLKILCKRSSLSKTCKTHAVPRLKRIALDPDEHDDQLKEAVRATLKSLKT